MTARGAVSVAAFVAAAIGTLAGCAGTTGRKHPPTPTLQPGDPGAPTWTPTAGPSGTLVLASLEASPACVTADASYVYWVNQGDFAVRRVAKSGGPIVTLATMARQVAVIGESGSFLFCGETAASATAVSVVRIPKVGGPPTSIAATGRVSSLVVDANMVCWADRDAGMVLAVAFTGGTICPMASGLSNPGALTHDASYVYFGEQVSGGRIGRALKYLGPWNALAWNNCWPTAMAFDASGLYFSEPPCGRISEVALTGGMAMAVASGLSNAESVAIGGSNLYWADRATGEVAKGLLTGGPVTVLANGLLDPIQIVLDASYVYVAERGAGRILRLNR